MKKYFLLLLATLNLHAATTAVMVDSNGNIVSPTNLAAFKATNGLNGGVITNGSTLINLNVLGVSNTTALTVTGTGTNNIATFGPDVAISGSSAITAASFGNSFITMSQGITNTYSHYGFDVNGIGVTPTNFTAAHFYGDGSHLTGITGGSLNGPFTNVLVYTDGVHPNIMPIAEAANRAVSITNIDDAIVSLDIFGSGTIEGYGASGVSLIVQPSTGNAVFGGDVQIGIEAISGTDNSVHLSGANRESTFNPDSQYSLANNAPFGPKPQIVVNNESFNCWGFQNNVILLNFGNWAQIHTNVYGNNTITEFNLGNPDQYEIPAIVRIFGTNNTFIPENQDVTFNNKVWINLNDGTNHLTCSSNSWFYKIGGPTNYDLVGYGSYVQFHSGWTNADLGDEEGPLTSTIWEVVAENNYGGMTNRNPILSTSIIGITVNTNFVINQFFTNTTGRSIELSGVSVTLTNVGVVGNSGVELWTNGVMALRCKQSSTTLTVGSTNTYTFAPLTITNQVICVYSNVSSGTGDGASISGGQYK